LDIIYSQGFGIALDTIRNFWLRHGHIGGQNPKGFCGAAGSCFRLPAVTQGNFYVPRKNK